MYRTAHSGGLEIRRFFQRIRHQLHLVFQRRTALADQPAKFQQTGYPAGIVISSGLVAAHIVMCPDNNALGGDGPQRADHVFVGPPLHLKRLITDPVGNLAEFAVDVDCTFI
jgi:hypothetical protein